MKDVRIVPLATLILLLLAAITTVRSQGLMGGFKGHHHRGTGAVELLLATGILAKLLNHRAKHGASQAGRHILHALLGGHRYSARQPQARFPMDYGAHPALLQDDLIEPHASMAFNILPDSDLMLNQESALLAAKAPLMLNPGMPMISDSHFLAEAQLGQQLLAARRARKLLEAKKLLAAQEAKNILQAQREAATFNWAAQEAAQTSTLLTTPSQQILTSAPPPGMMTQKQQMNHGHQGQGNNQAMMNNMMQAESGHHPMRNMMARADHFVVPPGLSDEETAQILANFQFV